MSDSPATYFGRPITQFVRPHGESHISEDVALSWYLDSNITRMVAVGGRILDWHAHRAGQISDTLYLSQVNQTDEQYREFRDAHR